jgi:hypothetical protein
LNRWFALTLTKNPVVAEAKPADFLAELFNQFDSEEQAKIRAAEESTKEILAGGDAAASDRQRAAGSRVAPDWVRQPQDDARVDALGVVFDAYYNVLWQKTDVTSAEGVDRFKANINKLRTSLGFWHTGSRSQRKMRADDNVKLKRWLGRNGYEAEREEKLLQDARAWAKAKLRKLALEVQDVFELKERVVSETWGDFLPTHRYRTDLKLGYLEFEAALWEEGSPSLEDWAIDAILERAPSRRTEASDGERTKTVAEMTSANDGSPESAGRPKLPADVVQKIFDAEKTAAEQSDRTTYSRGSQDESAFVAAYKENSAKSAELLAQQRRTEATPKLPVLYRDLEHTIAGVWQVLPQDVTVNHVRHALDVLGRNSDDGHVELDQQYCDGYGIDYSSLMTLIGASLAGVSDLSSGPKVPRKSTLASSMVPNSVLLPPSIWSKVKAISAVLKTKLNQGEDKDRVICESLQRCFDVLVEDGIAQGRNLDFPLLHQALPDKVLESAVALEWLEPVWGPQNIACGYQEWFMRLLEGRIEYFEACEFGRPFGHEHQKPDFVIKPYARN